MSEMIRCDKCKKDMYADSRSGRGAYAQLRTTYTDGCSTMHLCKTCYRQFLAEFMRMHTPEEFDEIYGK